jgi:glycosyltransferase involved in cell wall biosynthesis
MRALLMSFSNSGGGADRAAQRIHDAVQRSGVDATLAVAEVVEHVPGTREIPYRGLPGHRFLRRNVGDWALWLQKSSNPMHRSINIVPSGALPFVNSPEWDVVHLHWMGRDTLSITDIGKIQHPIVWTLHDSWPFSGADHHPEDEHDDRFAHGYTSESRRPGNSRFDLDAWVFHRKVRAWKRPLWLAAPSRYMAELASRSTLTSTWPCRVIPNPIDTDVFSPSTDAARDARVRDRLGVDPTAPLLLVGSSPGSPRNKGWDLLVPALRSLAVRFPDVTCVQFGGDESLARGETGLPLIRTGHIHDVSQLVDLYRTATAMIVPSRLESFSQTAAEAQACGTPVVAFATSGLLDVVEDGGSGLLARPGDSRSLSESIERLITDDGLRARLSNRARERAERLWSPAVVGKAYREWYHEALGVDENA